MVGSIDTRWIVTDDSAEWDTVQTRAVGFAADLDPTLGPSEIVYRREPGAAEWVPWVLVAPSVALRSVGIRQMGLYALRRFNGPRKTKLGNTTPGDRIGRYTGEVLGTFSNIESEEASERIQTWVSQGRTSLLTFRVLPGEGVSVVDGFDGSPPYLFRTNDPKGTTRKANVRYTATGMCEALQTIPGASLEATNLEDIAASELLVRYEAGGRGYWRAQYALGRQERPIVLDRPFDADEDVETATTLTRALASTSLRHVDEQNQ